MTQHVKLEELSTCSVLFPPQLTDAAAVLLHLRALMLLWIMRCVRVCGDPGIVRNYFFALYPLWTVRQELGSSRRALSSSSKGSRNLVKQGVEWWRCCIISCYHACLFLSCCRFLGSSLFSFRNVHLHGRMCTWHN